MSTTDRLPLAPGQRLTRAEFHRLYQQMPPGVRAELIGGVVHMPSPLSFGHGDVNAAVVFWLAAYQARTPGVQASTNPSVLLDDRSEPQPDALLRVLPECGGATRHEGPYIAGPPELVVEVARSSRALDLGEKLRDYRRAGVEEYLVVALEPDEARWHRLHEGRYEPLRPGADGTLRSAAFPGLWLDPAALFAGDLATLAAALDRGLAAPGHAEFVARLAERRERT